MFGCGSLPTALAISQRKREYPYIMSPHRIYDYNFSFDQDEVVYNKNDLPDWPSATVKLSNASLIKRLKTAKSTSDMVYDTSSRTGSFSSVKEDAGGRLHSSHQISELIQF